MFIASVIELTMHGLDILSLLHLASYWGEPERAPYKREVHAACLSVCLFVCTFMTRKYTRAVLIYRALTVVDCSVYGAFSELPCMLMLNKCVVTSNIARFFY